MSARQAEQKAATWGEALGGLIALALLLVVGSCVFGGGSSEKTAQAAPEVTRPLETQPTPAESEPSAISGAREPDSSSVSEAAGTVAFIIGLNGYHCIKVIDAQSAGSGVYDVTCITDHHGHQATYMVNSRNNDVARI